MTETPLERVLARLQHHKQSGDQWRGPCPAHGGKNPNLVVSEGQNGAVLLRCHSRGCEVEDIVAAVGLTPSDLFKSSPGSGNRGLEMGGATESAPIGYTLEEYAQAKKLPVDFLKSLGIADDLRYMKGARTLRIPYFDLKGNESAVRRRIRMTGDRFRWMTGSRPHLYGLQELKRARDSGYVILCEGESDVQTLLFHGIPALGLPGAGNWSEGRDAPLFEGIGRIYVVIEPDAGGEQVEKWLSRSSIRSRSFLLTLGAFKGPSQLHCNDPDTFVERLDESLRQAITWEEYEKRNMAEAGQSSYEDSRELAESPDVLARFARDFEATGHVGESNAAKLLFLAMVSRHFPRPVSVVVKGPSSAGKSHLVASVLRFFNPEAAYELTAMSDRALAYSEEPLKQRMLVVYEAAGIGQDAGNYLMRSLLSEGRLRYETVEKTSQGLKPRLIEREGPTGLILTTTASSLHPENETRLLSITVSDSPQQTRNVLRAIADPPAISTEEICRPWHSFDRWITSNRPEVDVPFSTAIADSVNIVGVRLRRDFPTLLTMIKVHALLHQAKRSRSGDGHIVATLEDYAAVRELLEPLVSEGLQVSVSSLVRETVAAVERLTGAEPREVAGYEVAAELGLDPSSASRRVKVAIEAGYIENRASGRGHEQRLVVVRPLPDETFVFPTVEAVRLSLGQKTSKFEVEP